MNLYKENCLERMRKMDDKSVDIIFTDPPYALGSSVIIRSDGKPDYSKAVDFMDKWEQPDGKFWEEWFIEAHRILKYGGRIIMFGMDRQLMLNKYYACAAGFQEQQSLYWYFINNFPKASDLSKMINKSLGVIRKRVLVKEKLKEKEDSRKGSYCGYGIDKPENNAVTDIAQKYNGYKYSVAPLKQNCETIMVFQKEYKTGSCLHDVLAYEEGDKECLCGALNIEGNRVPLVGEEGIGTLARKNPVKDKGMLGVGNGDSGMQKLKDKMEKGDSKFFIGVKAGNPVTEIGRFPAQSFIHDNMAEKLDKQADSVSKILHKCKYDEGDYDLFQYSSKTSRKEREDNNHPTVKPLSLLRKVLSLFKTPIPQVILDPFMGSGTTGIVCNEMNIEFIGIEMNKEYYDISCSRIKNGCQKTVDITEKNEVEVEDDLFE